MSGPTRTEGEPHNRITRLCDAATKAIEAHPEYDGEKLILFMDGKDGGGLVMNGYDDDLEALVNLMVHLSAIFKANGKELIFAPLNKG